MAWLGTWGNRIKITQSGTNVDSNLAWFPVPLFINSAAGTGSSDVATPIFTNLTTNSRKLAVTLADGTTELYVEIQQWEYDAGTVANSEAFLWVSKTGLNTLLAAGGTLYIYYDSTHAVNTNVNVIGTGNAVNVWDGDFLGVYHLNGSYDGTSDEVLDSTSNGFDGTATDAPTQTTSGKIGNAQNFEATDSNYITLGTQLGKPAAYTVEYWLKAESWENACVVNSGDGSEGTIWGIVHRATGDFIEVWGSNGTDGDYSTDAEWNSTYFPNTDFVRVVGTFSSKTAKYYRDGTEQDSETLDYDNEGTAKDLSIGRVGSAVAFYADGIVDEVRVSDVARTAAWVKADFYCQDDDILSWGGRETVGTVAIAAISSLSVDGNAIRSAISDIESIASLTISGNRTAAGAIAIATISALTIDGDRIASGIVAVSAIASLLAAGNRTATAFAIMDSVASLSTDGDRIATAIAAIESISSLTLNADRIAAAALAINALSSLTITSVRQRAAIAAINAVSSLDIDGDRIASAIAIITAVASMTAKMAAVYATVLISAVSSLITDANRIAGGDAAIESISSLIADGNFVAAGIVSVAAISALVVDGNYITTAAVAIAAIASLTALSTQIIQGAVVITTASAVEAVALSYITQLFGYTGTLAAGDVLVIDTDAMTVKLNGSSTRPLMTGTFPLLYVGTNELRWKDGGEVPDLNFETAHEPRYL